MALIKLLGDMCVVASFPLFINNHPIFFVNGISILYSYQVINRYLEEKREIGHQLTNRMEVKEVYDVFITKLG